MDKRCTALTPPIAIFIMFTLANINKHLPDYNIVRKTIKGDLYSRKVLIHITILGDLLPHRHRCDYLTCNYMERGICLNQPYLQTIDFAQQMFHVTLKLSVTLKSIERK